MPFGRIVHVNPERGFGFLKADAPPFDSAFFHFSEMARAGVATPEKGMAFSYRMGTDERSGRLRALDLELLPVAEA